MNMGIFGKGKSSSSIKLRDVPDLSFSETQFLSRQDRGPSVNVPGTGTAVDESPLQKKLGGQHPRSRTSHYVFREPPKLVSNEPPFVYHEESPPYTRRGDLLCPSKSQGVVPSPSAAAPVAQDSLGIKDRLHELHSQLPPYSVQKSQSPTPYSWSVSDRCGSQQSKEVEDRLLKILHTGLSLRRLGSRSDSGDSRSGYRNFQDLKNIFESRKAYWQTQMSPGAHSLNGTTSRIETRESSMMVAGAVQSPIKTALSPFRESEAGPGNNDRATNCENSLDELLRSPQRNRYHSYEGKRSKNGALPSQLPLPAYAGPEPVEPGAEDDFTFFQELDAAYCAILELKGADDDPLEQRSRVKNESHRSFVRQTQREGHPSYPARHVVSRGSRDTLLCGQPDLCDLTAFANPSPLPPDDMGTFPRDNTTKLRHSELTSDLLAAGPVLLPKRQSRDQILSKTAPESYSPIPPGFWRQKRLY
ncbi:hypothetical protein PMG11_05972 [Penicillium brasilianum]|uniref:Uncharacterized protein n=1 Tax=Penicillium brasilianum TaxID=104259 RepID=A0A0F7TKG9_PENBI|nr:hypothetical protein PMG11_05972 [Penicillium brasilianum]